jgi:thioredoxin-dependent peroxiredoxin
MTKTNSNLNAIESKSLLVGNKASDFTAKIQNPDGTISDFNLCQELKNSKVMLVFYPGDNTPGCTTQLCGIQNVYSKYNKLGVKVVGVNHAGSESHLRFIQKFEYPFGIIVDEDKSIREKFGAVGSFFGKPTTKRSVFLLDHNGVCLFRFFGQQDNDKIFELLEGVE